MNETSEDDLTENGITEDLPLDKVPIATKRCTPLGRVNEIFLSMIS
jgi:hypothetical protein